MGLSTLALCCCLILPSAGLACVPDATSLLQGSVHQERAPAAAISRASLVQRDVEEVAEVGSEIAEDHGEATAGKAAEVDMMSRELTEARKELQQSKRTAVEARRRIKVLEEENSTAASKWERSHSKKQDWEAKATSARLKQKERAGLKGKHLHFDHKSYKERVKQGNFSTYGLWNPSNEKQHLGEKTWDILSNHIFGLDKLAKNIWNATEYDQSAAKYRAYEKYYSAKAAAAQQEMAELTSTLQAAEERATHAEETIARLTVKRAEVQASVREARKQLAREKAARKREQQKLSPEEAAKLSENADDELEGEEAPKPSENEESEPEGQQAGAGPAEGAELLESMDEVPGRFAPRVALPVGHAVRMFREAP